MTVAVAHRFFNTFSSASRPYDEDEDDDDDHDHEEEKLVLPEV